MGAKHVAKAHGHALHLRVAGEALDEHLGDALGGAHDVGGVDGLVRGELHQPLNAVFGGGGEQVERAKDVVFHRLGAAFLHQRHVLVRGGVEDDGGVKFRKQRVQFALVADGADAHEDGAVRPVALPELAFQLVGAVFVDVEDDEQFRLKAHHLPADLRADGAAAAGDQHHLAGQIAADGVHIQRHFVAGEEVRGIDLAEGLPPVHGALLDAAGVGEYAHAALGGFAHGDDLVEAVALDAGNGDDDLGNALFLHQIGDVHHLAEHGDAAHAQAALFGIVVHESHRRAGEVPPLLTGARRVSAALARADDEHAVVLRVAAAGEIGLAADLPAKARAAHQQKVKNADQRKQRARHLPGEHAVAYKHHARGRRAEEHQAKQLSRPGIAPHHVIHAAHDQRPGVEHHQQGDALVELHAHGGADGPVVAQDHRQLDGYVKQRQIQQDQHAPADAQAVGTAQQFVHRHISHPAPFPAAPGALKSVESITGGC